MRKSLKNIEKPKQALAPEGTARPDRFGKKGVLVYLSLAAKREVDHLAVDLGLTKQELLAAAINLLLEKHGRPPIA